MLVIPAIDLRDGCCVRLIQGDPHKQKIYSREPVSMAKLWHLKGAQWLHVVDLDGAFEGKPKNMDIVKKIVREVKVKVEFGGGVRSLDTISELMDAGVKRVILGTSAVSQTALVEKAVAKYGKSIAVALDVKKGRLATHGWKEVTAKSAIEVARDMQKMGVRLFIFTDVRRDGMLKGPSIKPISDFLRGVDAKVIASGGVTRLPDIHKLKKLERRGVIGAIVGKALYSGDLDLKEAIEAGKRTARRSRTGRTSR